jgi:NitT/TauT family transport system substrate-binding protein
MQAPATMSERDHEPASGPPRRRRTAMIGCAALAATAAIALAGCGGSSSSGASSSGASASPGGTTSLTVGVAAGVGPLNADIAVGAGIFKRHGLDVKPQVLNNGGAEGVAALESGSMQIVESNIVSVIQAAQHGISQPSFAGGVKMRNQITNVLVGGTSVHGAADLVGKKIAVSGLNSANQILVDAYLNANGIDYRKVTYISLPLPSMIAALHGGAVAAAVMANPWATEWLKAGGHLLSENAAKYIGSPEYACWTATKKWLSSNADVARKWLASLDQADSLFMSNRAQASADASPVVKLPTATLTKVGTWTYNTTMTVGDINKWYAAGKKFGVITGSVDTSQLYKPVQ